MSQKFSRRTVLQRTLLATSATLFPGLIPLAVSQSQDPVAIIEGFAKELFALFGELNGNSDRYASRRQALTAVVDDRFAYDDMIETAAAVAVPEMDDEQLVQLHGLGRDLVVDPFC